MRLTVWKYVYPLPREEAEIEMPHGAEVLCAREQPSEPDAYRQVCIWARIDAEEPRKEVRKFRLCGTGHDAPADRYVGTAITCGGALVWHVFEVRP